MTKKEKEDLYYQGPQSFSPVPLHVASAVIKPLDGNNIRSVALTTMEKQANQQIEMLKRQAELIMTQVREIEQRVQVSAQIYQADMNFEPAIGNKYYLYNKNDKRFMSMIGPSEWDVDEKELIYMATIELNPDKTWEIIELGMDYEQSDL